MSSYSSSLSQARRRGPVSRARASWRSTTKAPNPRPCPDRRRRASRPERRRRDARRCRRLPPNANNISIVIRRRASRRRRNVRATLQSPLSSASSFPPRSCTSSSSFRCRRGCRCHPRHRHQCNDLPLFARSIEGRAKRLVLGIGQQSPLQTRVRESEAVMHGQFHDAVVAGMQDWSQ